MDVKEIRSIYFLGIGGIGMSALARYFLHRGVWVAGYDKTPTPLTEELIHEGIPIHFIEDIHQIPHDLDIVVYTPAIPDTHKELVHLREKSVPMVKRAEMLGMLTKGKFTIAVAGTHGKTTITSLIAHILVKDNIKVHAFIGGISKNFKTNLVDGNDADVMVVEADEFDRSFLHLEPDIAIISAMDADHLDIYGSYEQMVASYQAFTSKIKPGGYLVLNNSIRRHFPYSGQMVTVSVASSEASCSIHDLHYTGGKPCMEIILPGGHLGKVMLGIPGLFNVENALFAVIASHLAGASEPAVREGMGSFAGVERRFDFRIVTDRLVYIDDYAHHPNELTASIRAAREIYPGRKLTGVFQPHLYTRTRDFSEDFARSLSQLDEVILLDIYPAREEPIEGITSEVIMKDITLENKYMCTKGKVVERLKEMHLEVLMTLGAGDIDQVVAPIERMLRGRIANGERGEG